ncbi:putative signal peptidase I [Helianthus annuus]|nr:putative signal peptidase I [Helianthus annuus]KAJ0643351.1 putative signal peptidase I [Helianthus annuus]
MGFIGDQIDSLKSLKVRQALEQVITLGTIIFYSLYIFTIQSIYFMNLQSSVFNLLITCMIVSSALIIWKFLMCVTGSESPVVVVLSESMEPAFQRRSKNVLLYAF